MNTNTVLSFAREFDIPPGLAAAVLGTHIFVLFVPLAVIWAVDVYGAGLPIAYPMLVKLASAVYIAATAFEVAQNSADRWYLTEATRSVADLFFNALMTLAFCLYTIAFSANIWMSAAAIILTLVFPFAYIRNHPAQRAFSGFVVLLGTVSLFVVTNDPTAFLFLVINGIAVYLIVVMFQCGSQWLHAWAAFVFGVAFLAWPWAIMNAASGATKSLLYVALIAGALIFVTALATPLMRRMPATPRYRGKA